MRPPNTEAGLAASPVLQSAPPTQLWPRPLRSCPHQHHQALLCVWTGLGRWGNGQEEKHRKTQSWLRSLEILIGLGSWDTHA